MEVFIVFFSHMFWNENKPHAEYPVAVFSDKSLMAEYISIIVGKTCKADHLEEAEWIYAGKFKDNDNVDLWLSWCSMTLDSPLVTWEKPQTF